MARNEKEVKENLFGFGDFNSAYAKYFEGDSFLKGLASDEESGIGVGQVSFEPGCRNHWHRHVGGFQILICTAGEGWYQAEGQPAQKMTPGDVVIVPDGVKHWHGASPDSWFSHLAVTKGKTEWLEEVADYDEITKEK